MGEGESKDKNEPTAEDAPAADEDTSATENWEVGKEGGGTETVDISDTPAPSIGPHTTFDKRSAEERLAGSEQSDTDAMGLDKRRQIIGGTYGPTKTRQLVTWVIVVAVIGGAAFGLSLLASDLDKPPAKVEDQAPWTGSDKQPAPLQ
jgi:hypothetical protein